MPYNGCNYLSMLGLKLNHVSKRGSWSMFYLSNCVAIFNIDGLVQERRNSRALAMELRLSCTNPSIWFYIWLCLTVCIGIMASGCMHRGLLRFIKFCFIIVKDMFLNEFAWFTYPNSLGWIHYHDWCLPKCQWNNLMIVRITLSTSKPCQSLTNMHTSRI